MSEGKGDLLRITAFKNLPYVPFIHINTLAVIAGELVGRASGELDFPQGWSTLLGAQVICHTTTLMMSFRAGNKRIGLATKLISSGSVTFI